MHNMDVNHLSSAHEALRAAVKIAGSQSAFGRMLGVTQRAVWRWLHEGKVLPAEHVLTAEAGTGVSRSRLRPDLYPIEAAAPLHADDADTLEQAG